MQEDDEIIHHITAMANDTNCLLIPLFKTHRSWSMLNIPPDLQVFIIISLFDCRMPDGYPLVKRSFLHVLLCHALLTNVWRIKLISYRILRNSQLCNIISTPWLVVSIPLHICTFAHIILIFKSGFNFNQHFQNFICSMLNITTLNKGEAHRLTWWKEYWLKINWW